MELLSALTMVVLKGCAGFVYNVLEAAQLLQEWEGGHLSQ